MIGFLYNWIQTSWEVSAIVVKYALLVFAGYQVSLGSNMAEARADLNRYSHYFIAAIILISLPLSITGVEVVPVIPIIGEFVALAFYAYLFWEY